MSEKESTIKPPISLVLISPRVESIGYSYLVAPGEIHPSEEQVEQLRRNAKNPQAGIVAASHSVTQVAKKGDVRDAEEFLICTGASRSLEDADVIRSVLNDLLQSLPEPKKQLHPGKRVDGLVCESELISEIEEAFNTDKRVQEIERRIERWTPYPAIRHESAWNRAAANPLLNWFLQHPIMKNLVIAFSVWLLFLACGKGGDFWQHFKASISKSPNDAEQVLSGRSSSPESAPERKALDVWRFLLEVPWPEFMNATGGKDAAKSLDGAIASGTSDHPLLQKLETWAQGVNSEFLMGLDPPINAGLFEHSVLSKIQSKLEGSPWATWFENTNDRWGQIPELQEHAQALRDFAVSLNWPTQDNAQVQARARDEKLHELIEGLRKALDHYNRDSSGSANPIRGEIFSGFQNGVSKLVLRPQFTIVTPRDAVRLQMLRYILGSRTFMGIWAEATAADPISTKDWEKTFPGIGTKADSVEHGEKPARVFKRAGWEEVCAYIKNADVSKVNPPTPGSTLLNDLKAAIAPK